MGFRRWVGIEAATWQVTRHITEHYNLFKKGAGLVGLLSWSGLFFRWIRLLWLWECNSRAVFWLGICLFVSSLVIIPSTQWRGLATFSGCTFLVSE